jgi:hypothetical protein
MDFKFPSTLIGTLGRWVKIPPTGGFMWGSPVTSAFDNTRSDLKGLWTHTKGGFYHDGRFATLDDVVQHYNSFFGLGLSDSQVHDLVQYLNSL